MEDNKSYTFVRGQVWHWEDPIFGRKDDNSKIIPQFDSSVRFSRYVVIMQATRTINSVSLLVIPCSGCTKTQFDVQIPIPYSIPGDITYARVNSIFPAHPKALQRYICTLSEATMKRIEDAILKLIVPSIGGEVECQDILESTNIEEVINNDKSITPSITNGVKRKIGEVRWDDETMRAFVKMYREDVEKACKEFNLKESSAYSYYRKWKKQIPATDDTKAVLPVTDNTKGVLRVVNNDVKPSNFLNNYSDIRLAVSKLANIMKSVVERDASIYDTAKPYIRYQISKSDFYEGIRNVIYYSLLEYLDIKRESMDTTIPEIDYDANKDTWEMLQKAFYSRDYSGSVEYYATTQRGINRNWLTNFKSNLMSRVRLMETGLSMVCDRIDELFCIKDKKDTEAC